MSELHRILQFAQHVLGLSQCDHMDRTVKVADTDEGLLARVISDVLQEEMPQIAADVT